MTEAVVRVFGGRDPAAEARQLERMTVSELAAAVRAAAGSQKAAAAQLGVNVATCRRWQSGAVKAPKGLGGLRAAAQAAGRRSRMGPRKEARLRGKPHIGIRGILRVSRDTRDRATNLGAAPFPLGPAVDAYLRGDDALAAQIVGYAIGGRGPSYGEPSGIIPGLEVLDVTTLRIGGRV